MALLTDDCDLNQNQLLVEFGGNGDWYVTVCSPVSRLSVRISMSGGIAPTDVKLAVAKLGQAMYEHGLNESPKF